MPTRRPGRTLARAAEHEDHVNGSRFIARVAPVHAVGEAEELLRNARADHPDAHHHCWAYRVGDAQRFSDDGEPGGTAGRPMLEVFLKRGLDGAAAVVVRYFGGRKLGAGGLARAYQAAVARAVQAAGEREVLEAVRLRVRVPFALVDAVIRHLDERGVHRSEVAFGSAGGSVEVSVPVVDRAALERDVADVTRGAADVTAAAGGQESGDRGV